MAFNKTGKDLCLNDLNKALFVTVYLAFVTPPPLPVLILEEVLFTSPLFPQQDLRRYGFHEA